MPLKSLFSLHKILAAGVITAVMISGCDARPPQEKKPAKKTQAKKTKPAPKLITSQYRVPLQVKKLDGVTVKNGVVTLFSSVPKQPEKGGIVCLEAENYDDVTWQAASTKTMVSERWIEQVQKRGMKECTPDEEASQGACVERATALSYPFYVSRPGKYDVWVRLWRPSHAFWCYNQQINDISMGRTVLNREVESKKWFWQKTGTVNLKKGNNIFFVQHLHSGKRMDKIVFAPKDNFKPEGKGPEKTVSGAITEGTALFAEFTPADVTSFDRISLPRINQAGMITLKTSFDGGKTWQPVGTDGRIKASKGKKTILAKLTLKADQAGSPPYLGTPEVVFTAPEKAFPVLTSEHAKYTFSSKTGAISGIELTGKNNVRIVPAGSERDPFRIRIKPDLSPPVQGEWAEFSAFKMTGQKAETDSVSFMYRHKKLPINISTRYVLKPEGYLDCRIEIENNHKADVVEAEFPRLTLAKIGSESADDSLIWPVGTGKIYSKPTGAGRLTMTYPKAVVGYFDLYDDTAGLYAATQDPELISTVMEAKPDTSRTYMDVNLTKRDQVKAGGGKKEFKLVIGAHPGDWHAGADWYKAWYSRVFDPVKWPDWIAESDGWLFGNATFSIRHYDHLRKLYREAIRLGFQHIQMWGTNYVTGGGGQYYYPPPYMGGHKAFAKNNKWWKDLDGIIGYYMFPNGINSWVVYPEHKKYFGVPWKEIPKWGRPPMWDEGKSWKWAEKNAKYNWERKPPEPPLKRWKQWEKKWKRYNHGPCPSVTVMCPKAEEWLEWYKYWVVDKYTRDFHTGASYNDTMHYGAEDPMYNPYLNQHGNGDGGKRRQKWAKNIRDEARKYNPDYLPIMEMQCDAYGMYFSYMIGASAIDSELLRYTHPDHLAFEGQTGSGQYGMKRFKRFGSAWCYGTRLDHRHSEAWAVAVIKMRNWITRWLNDARFMDNSGLKVENPDIRGKLHRLMTTDGSRGFTATFWHQKRHDYLPENFTLKNKTYFPSRVSIDLGPMAAVDNTGTKPEDWIPNRAILVDFNQTPREIHFDVVRRNGRPHVEFMLPSRWINGVVFVREARKKHAYLSFIDQKDFKQLDVHVLNLSDKPLNGKVRLDPETFKLPGTEKTFTAAPGKHAVVTFPYENGKPPVVSDLVKVNITADGATRTIRAGMYPPCDDPSFEVESEYLRYGQVSDKYASDGKHSLKSTTLGFICEPNTKYRLSIKVRPEKKNHKCTLLFNPERRGANRKDGVQLEFGKPFQLEKDKWNTVSATFKTPELFYHGKIRLEGRRASIFMDDFKLEKLSENAPVEFKAEYQPK